jgi:hypothetical protein
MKKIKPKKPIKIEHLVNWYFGNFCARCGKIDMENENHGRNCYEKLQAIAKGIKVQGMTHNEFVLIVKSSPFCKPIKRIFPECPICKALGVPQRK